ncbi:MAG: hypothetical protein CL823_05060 [Crocinitomicaceae bacterium]|nr:hypothetical protein [Crocinitomicaceae bacterium]|tara:strand:+ start:1410 stop:3266 length:1857 start_codon:yes stop_codon:yes gene_type:complete
MRHVTALTLVIVLASFNCIAQGAPHSDYLGAGHITGVTVTTSGTGFFGEGVNTINASGLDQHLRDAARFLGQSTTGANYEAIESLSTESYETWIDNQMVMPEMTYLDSSKMVWDHFVQAYFDEWGQIVIEGNEDVFPASFYWRMAWWHNAMHGEDLLRQKVALALSELLVVSEDSRLDSDAFGLASYYDVLYSNAFGNYRDLLEEVTYHPAMGYYLSSINNEPTNEEMNIHPDENYAREIMQLFTIGLYELNQDGTLILDSGGMPIETYDNSDIGEFARVFTGLGPAGYWAPWEDYSEEEPIWGVWYNTIPFIDATQPMLMFEDYHEGGVKHLLNGAATLDGASGEEDIDVALDNLFYHQNTAPFVSKNLIMRLVKSNPTPEYVARVASVFNDNGAGVKGDLGAVVKAILLDVEARDCEWISDPYSGKMREPMIRYIQLLKAFDAQNESGKMFSVGWNTSDIQHPLNSPSVFNFFLPTYAPSGPIMDSSLVAPEFELLNSTIAIEYINMSFDIIWSENYMESITLASPENIGYPWWEIGFSNPEDHVELDFNEEISLAAYDPAAMIERLNLLLGGGTISSATMQTIVNIIDVDYLEPSDRVKLALYFILISPDYVIQK